MDRPLTACQRHVLERVRDGWRLYIGIERSWLERDAPYLNERVLTNTATSLIARKLVKIESPRNPRFGSRFTLTAAAKRLFSGDSGA